jgi:hypothetical protein
VSLPERQLDEQNLRPHVSQSVESAGDKNTSRRITPVSVASADQNDVFMRVPIVPAPAHAMPRSVWAHPRNLKSHRCETTLKLETMPQCVLLLVTWLHGSNRVTDA